MLNAVFRMDGGAPDTERTLGFHLNSRTAFADYSVAAIGRVGDGAEGTDDTACWWSISGRPVTDDRGRFVGFIGSGSDLTEKRRSDAEITPMARSDELPRPANSPDTTRCGEGHRASRPEE